MIVEGPALAIVAHPDDETLGCGGTLARLAAQTTRVGVIVVATGDPAGSRSDRDAVELRDHFMAALTRLGILTSYVENAGWLGYGDQLLDQQPIGALARHLAERIALWRPRTIFTHSPTDLNADHRRVVEAVLVATRPCADRSTVPAVYACEVPSSTEWAFGLGAPFVPNVFVDITLTIDAKLAAMEHYLSERRDPPHPRAADSLRALARLRGAACGTTYAEAFALLRALA